MNSLYLAINIATIIFPLILSFHKGMRLNEKWGKIWPAILITASVFLVWDWLFTKLGVWSFNQSYIIGIKLFNLPIEEILFFITVPYSSIFIYEVVKSTGGEFFNNKVSNYFTFFLIIALITLGIIYFDRLYTSVNFFSGAAILIIAKYFVGFKKMSIFWFSYLIILFPFLIVNGILTGSFISEPVVFYDNSENLGIRIFTIPVEDTIYGMTLIISSILIYDKN